jgi:hypothetical protein
VIVCRAVVVGPLAKVVGRDVSAACHHVENVNFQPLANRDARAKNVTGRHACLDLVKVLQYAGD